MYKSIEVMSRYELYKFKITTYARFTHNEILFSQQKKKWIFN